MRVIAGSARGVKLETLEGLETRPTTDRIKEAVFSMLHHKIMSSACLDLFSGSGALGIELLSRGAQHVTFIESNPLLKGIINRNLEKTHLSAGATIIFSDVYRALNALDGRQFDIILMDPPYRKGHVASCLEHISKLNLLNQKGVLVVEHDVIDDEIVKYPEYFESLKSKKYGKIGVTVLGRRL